MLLVRHALLRTLLIFDILVFYFYGKGKFLILQVLFISLYFSPILSLICPGTIAAMNNGLGVVGVSPGTVQLYIVRVFANDGDWAFSSDLVDAAEQCANAGANIINMSLGGPGRSIFEESAFNELYSRGVLSIAS